MKDPRVRIPLYFELNGKGIKTSKVNQLIDTYRGSLTNTEFFSYDISSFVDDEIRFVFEYHQDLDDYFHIGGIFIDDVTTSSSSPHYDQFGTSFAAPIVSGVGNVPPPRFTSI